MGSRIGLFALLAGSLLLMGCEPSNPAATPGAGKEKRLQTPAGAGAAQGERLTESGQRGDSRVGSGL